MDNINFPFKINNFAIKIIALLCMTLDHIGVFLQIGPLKADDPIVIVFRLIGQLAIPLFSFLISEGIKHTKNKGFYIARLGTVALIVSITLLIINKTLFSTQYIGNVFIDLVLGATACLCLSNKNLKIKMLSLLPIAFGITSMIVKNYEAGNNAIVYWFPYFIRSQFDAFSITLIVLFYLSSKLSSMYLDWYSSKSGIERDLFNNSKLERLTTNLISLAMLLTLSLLFIVINQSLSFKYSNVQGISILSGVFILLYNGKRGYNASWFKYGCYIYYPVHIAVLYLIFSLLGF